MSKIKLLVVDDHLLVRFAIVKLIEDNPQFKVVGEADSGEESLQLVDKVKPDIVLLDVHMPGMGGLETIRRLKKRNPEVKIIALSAFTDEPIPSRVLQSGANGYLTKKCPPDEMFVAIIKVMNGDCYLAPEVAQSLALKNLTQNNDASPFEQLSEREMQVMLMITSGLRVQEISDRLCLSTKTVNSYRYRIFAKMNIRNDVELTHLAIKHKVLEREIIIEDNPSDE